MDYESFQQLVWRGVDDLTLLIAIDNMKFDPDHAQVWVFLFRTLPIERIRRLVQVQEMLRLMNEYMQQHAGSKSHEELRRDAVAHAVNIVRIHTPIVDASGQVCLDI